AVAAVLRLDQTHVRIGQEFGARLWQHANERIVLSVDHQSGNGNPLRYARSAGAVVVVVGAGESAVARGYLFVEFADSPQLLQVLQFVAIGNQQRFAKITPPQTTK